MIDLYGVAVVFVVHLENPVQLVRWRGGGCHDDDHGHDDDDHDEYNL